MCKKSCKARNFLLKLILENSGLLLAESILIKSQNATILETLTVKVFSLHSAWKFKNHNDIHVILLFTGNQVAWGKGYVCIIDIWIISLYKLTKLGGNNPLRLILQPFPPLFLPHFSPTFWLCTTLHYLNASTNLTTKTTKPNLFCCSFVY